jgi:predicted phosphodiesterase
MAPAFSHLPPTKESQLKCSLDGCEKEFTPRRSNQIYCCASHGQLAYNKSRATKKDEIRLTDETEPINKLDAITALEKEGYVVTQPKPNTPVHTLDLKRIKGTERVRIGIVSDTHLCSTYQQLTYLREFYQYAEREAKVSRFLHAGDLSDGTHQAHRDAVYNQHRHGFDAQKNYIIDNYPESRVGTDLIGGNHDNFFINQDGADIVAGVCKQRDDMNYLGSLTSAYVDIEDIRILMQHPYTGSSYALSYRLQKQIEAMAPENKPHILLSGNFHKFCNIRYRNVEAFQLQGFQAQTPFALSKGLEFTVGGLILEFGVDPMGLAGSIKIEHIRFPQPIADDY